MTIKTAACVKNGIVVNTCVYDEDSSQGWLDSIKNEYDNVIITDIASIGWIEYEPNKVRAVQPSNDHVWNETDGWQLPPTENI